MTTTEKSGISARKLRILLIAYEFPPSPSPQSLRWAYLTGRLAELGHEVHVMAPDIPGTFAGLPDLGPHVQVHRLFPGMLRAALGKLAPHRDAIEKPVMEQTSFFGPVFASEPPKLNWKGDLLERFQNVISRVIFPDLRGEWLPHALRALPRVLDQVRPDVVISSHEPAITLQIGLVAKTLGYPWVADLGDPVLTSYTPARWQKRAMNVEQATLRQADHLVVTTAEAAQRLQARHKTNTPFTVIEQGFDERIRVPVRKTIRPNGRTLELIYSGSFYTFRDPSPLVEAVLTVPGIRLSIASGNLPGWLVGAAEASPDRLRLLGRVPHRPLLVLQREADVLVNLANCDSAQVPGKFYEYLGAGRPILHIQAGQQDAAGTLLGSLRRGWSVPGTRDEIARALTCLRLQHAAGDVGASLNLSASMVTRWSWSAAAARLQTAIEAAVTRSRSSGA